MAEAMLRGLVFFSIVGPKRFQKSTLRLHRRHAPISRRSCSLQYKDMIERQLKRLERAPEMR